MGRTWWLGVLGLPWLSAIARADDVVPAAPPSELTCTAAADCPAGASCDQGVCVDAPAVAPVPAVLPPTVVVQPPALVPPSPAIIAPPPIIATPIIAAPIATAVPRAMTTAEPVHVSSTVQADAPWSPPSGLAWDFEAAFGWLHAGDADYQFVGESSAIGGYLGTVSSCAIALVLMTSYQDIFSKSETVNQGFVGLGLRFTPSSQVSLRAGAGAALLVDVAKDPVGSALAGMAVDHVDGGFGLTSALLLTAVGRLGVSVDAGISWFDPGPVFRLGVSIALVSR